jgi:hypothetical protein
VKSVDAPGQLRSNDSSKPHYNRRIYYAN